MNIKKIIPCLLFMVLLLGGGLVTPVSAQSQEHEGLEAELLTDQEQYTSDERITSTVTVKNSGESAVNIISMEIQTPDGYQAISDSDAAFTGVLNPEETLTKTVTFVPEEVPHEQTEPDDGGNEPEESDSFISPVIRKTDTTEQNNNGNRPETKNSRRKTGSVNTADRNQTLLWLGLISVSCTVLAIGLAMRFNRKYLALLVGTGLAASVAVSSQNTVWAEEMSGRIDLTREIRINDEGSTITAYVEYEIIPAEEPVEDPVENPVEEPAGEEEQYYFNNSEVIDTVAVTESDEVMTESEANNLLRERGFTDSPVTSSYTMEGEYIESETADNSEVKHPMYQTTYINQAGEVWTVYIINGSLYAYPVSYKFSTQSPSDLLISESDTLTSYVCETNRFIITKPFASEALIKTVQTINAETLDRLTVEELKK